MGTEQDAGFSLRVVMGNDIGILQDRTIIALEVSLLGLYLAAKLLELAHNPFATLIVRLAVHHARTEIALCSTISQRRIGIKGRTYRIQLLCFLYFLNFRRTCAVGILIADSYQLPLRQPPPSLNYLHFLRHRIYFELSDLNFNFMITFYL